MRHCGFHVKQPEPRKTTWRILFQSTSSKGCTLGLQAFYHWRPNLKETLCESLMGRIKREIDRKSHSLIPIERVKTARETSKNLMARKVPVTEDLSIHINASTAAKLPPSVGTIHNFLFLLEVLLMGYVIVGNFTDRVTGTRFCSLQVVKDYLNYVRGKVAPLGLSLIHI